MSTFSSWSYTSDITIWPVTLDEYAQPQVGTSYVIKGTWLVGGPAQRDDDGIEFVPMETFWFESTDEAAPKRQWYIAKGNHQGTPSSASAELIRRVAAYDDTTFGADGPPDRVAYT